MCVVSVCLSVCLSVYLSVTEFFYLFRENKLTQLLQESVGNMSCRTHLIVHVSSLPQHYHDNLLVLQFASRIRKTRKQRGTVSKHVDKHKFVTNTT